MSKRLALLDKERCVGCQSCMFACARRPGVGGLAATSIWVRSAGGVRKGYVVIVCRACPDPPCARVCPTDALLLRQGGGVRLKAELQRTRKRGYALGNEEMILGESSIAAPVLGTQGMASTGIPAVFSMPARARSQIPPLAVPEALALPGFALT